MSRFKVGAEGVTPMERDVDGPERASVTVMLT